MDDTDRDILDMVQADCRRSNAEIGEAVGLSVSATNDRLRKLVASGIITGHHAAVDPEKLGLGLCAFVFVDLSYPVDEKGFAQALAPLPEVQEIHHVTGPHSYLVKLRVANPAELQTFMSKKLKGLKGVTRTETIIVLQSGKETARVRVGPIAAETEHD